MKLDGAAVFSWDCVVLLDEHWFGRTSSSSHTNFSVLRSQPHVILSYFYVQSSFRAASAYIDESTNACQ